MRLLTNTECLFYRDELRAARYAALADSESFNEVCFALEALGLRLLGRQADMGKYQSRISEYALKSPLFSELAQQPKSEFKTFDALYQIVKTARNDAMHTGAYGDLE